MKIERVPCNNNVFTGEELLDKWPRHRSSCFMELLTGVVYILKMDGDLFDLSKGTSIPINRSGKYALVGAKLVVYDPTMK